MHVRRSWSLAFAFLALFFGAPSTQTADAQPPNIIFIMADDLGWGELGSYGQEKIQTPHIDRLAAEGMRFTQAYAGSMVCQPSRAVLMTGLHTGHAAVRANDVRQMLLEQDVTVAEVLKGQGYTTGMFGKWGLGYEGTSGQPSRQGFDEFFGQLLQVHAHFYYPYWVWKNEERYYLPGNEGGGREQYVHDEIHAQAMEFIRQHHDEPFFAYLPYIIPHVELVVPEESELPYRGKFPRVPILDPRDGYLESEDGLVTFAAMVSRLDGHVGEVMSLVEELGIADRTLIIFTSDNGGQGGGQDAGWQRMTDFFEGNGPFRGYKGTMYEGGLRVPFIARWTGHVPPGTTSDYPVGFWDMLPTFAELAGARRPDVLDGISIVPTLLGEGEQIETRRFYWEYPRGEGIIRAARVGDWKIVQSRPAGDYELFHLGRDPGERHNLLEGSPSEDVLARRDRLISYMDAQHRPLREYPAGVQRSTIRDYVR